jgi:hypothetical protein
MPVEEPKRKFIQIGSPEYKKWEAEFENTFLGKEIQVEIPALKFAENLPEIKSNEPCKYGKEEENVNS